MLYLLFSLIFSFGTSSKVMLDLPPRFMWGWSPPPTAVGYCGSMSLQTVGLYYGNWITQDAARGTHGGHGPKNSLLLGGLHSSESHALKILHFNHTSWDSFHESTPQAEDFLQWSREAIYEKDPVIFGVYMKTLEDPDYDHIVPMVGYDDSGIYFNDLHADFSFRYEISDFVRSRKKCKGGSEEFDYCLPDSVDYGIRVHGNMDPTGVLLPIRMSVDSWKEPDYSKEDGHGEIPKLIHANVTISELTAGSKYALLRYEDPASVPKQDFLDSKYTKRQDFTPSRDEMVFKTSFMSNSTIFYRCIQI